MQRMIMNKSEEEVEEEVVEVEEGGGFEAKRSMKKGPWTAEEDAILIEYVNECGEGNWNSVQKLCGLTRCGKSCRLRWANHLRPDLKKGAFSQEEEQLIVELHAKLGNKWARMASLLQGRTDNEIKNFWNTRMKRLQRLGLPLYPPELEEEASLHNRLLLHQNKQHHAPSRHSPSSFSFLSLLASSTNHKRHNKRPKKSHLKNSAHSKSTYDLSNNNDTQYHHEDMGLPLLPSVSLNGFDYSSGGTLTDISSTLTDTPPSSYSSTGHHGGGFHGLMGGCGLDNYHEVPTLSSSTEENSGLLDAVLLESQTICGRDKRKGKSNDSASGNKRRRIVDEEDKDSEQLLESGGKKNNNNAEFQRDDFNSPQSSTEKKASSSVRDNDPLMMSSTEDDYLFTLLNNFQSEMPVPEWYRSEERQEAVEVGNQQNASLGPPDQQLAWTLGTFWSNDLPSIC